MVKVSSLTTTLLYFSNTNAFLGYQANNLFNPKIASKPVKNPVTFINAKNDNDAPTREKWLLPSKARNQMKKISSYTFVIIAQLLFKPKQVVANDKILPLVNTAVHSSSSQSNNNEAMMVQPMKYTKTIQPKQSIVTKEETRKSLTKMQQVTIGLLGGTMAGAILGGSKFTIERKKKERDVEGNQVLFEDIISTTTKQEEDDSMESTKSVVSDRDADFNALLEHIKTANSIYVDDGIDIKGDDIVDDDTTIMPKEEELDSTSAKLEEKKINEIASSFAPVVKEEKTSTLNDEIIQDEIDTDEIISFGTDDDGEEESQPDIPVLAEDDSKTSTIETVESPTMKDEEDITLITTPDDDKQEDTLISKDESIEPIETVLDDDDLEEPKDEESLVVKAADTISIDSEDETKEELLVEEIKEALIEEVANNLEDDIQNIQDVIKEEEIEVQTITSQEKLNLEEITPIELASDTSIDSEDETKEELLAEEIKEALTEEVANNLEDDIQNIQDVIKEEENEVQTITSQETMDLEETTPIELASDDDDDDDNELLLNIISDDLEEAIEEESIIMETTTPNNDDITKEEMIVQEIAKSLKEEQQVTDDNIYFQTEKSLDSTTIITNRNTTMSKDDTAVPLTEDERKKEEIIVQEIARNLKQQQEELKAKYDADESTNIYFLTD